MAIDLASILSGKLARFQSRESNYAQKHLTMKSQIPKRVNLGGPRT
jgi:hypothetical protein